jgi:hypothetical protein
MDLSLGIAVISMVAGVAAAYFAYVAVRGQFRRRPATLPSVAPPPPPPPPPPLPGEPEPRGPYDAFISYAEDDADKAEWVATGLRARGLRPFLAKWIGIGTVENAEKERALAASANGVLLLSKTTMSHPDISDEYAALLRQVHMSGRRFVPVLVEKIEKADLPPFIGIRRPLNLIDHDDSQAALDELARALR